MYRVFFFDQHMTIIDAVDRLATDAPHRWARARVRCLGYYTYAIGALR